MPISIWPAAVSADGTVVVGQACDGLGDNLNCPPVKVASTGGAPTALSLPAAVGEELRAGCEVQAVNGDGSWIGAGCIHASVEWKSSNSGTLVVGRNSGEVVSDLVDASLDGTIVLGRLHFTELGTDTAFRRIPTTGIVPVAADPNDQAPMVPNGISNDGLVVVGIGDGYALRWDPRNGTERLPKFDGDAANYRAFDVSGDGTVVVGDRSGNAIRWPSPTVVQSLGEGVAWAVSNRGTITVGRSIATATALAWDAAGTRKAVLELVGSTPDVAGWTLKEAVGVSDDGKVIVGRGINSSQQSQGWVVRLP